MTIGKVLMHVSASQFPKLSIHHSTKEIWIELAKGFDSYHLIARSLSNKFEYYNEGNLHLYLIPKISNKSRWFFFTSWVVIYYYFKIKPTHILSQSAIFGGAVCVFLNKLFKVPIMTEIHGEEYFRILEGNKGIRKIGSIYLKYIYNNSNKVRSLNSFMTNKLNRHQIKNIVEIRGRFNLNVFKKYKENFEISNDVLRLVTVGRFVKEKNYLKLIKVLVESDLNFHLTLIGGGILKDDYLTYINQTNSKNKFTLIDWCSQAQLVEFIISSDIYIQSSSSEGMPRTIIEAMALKMPIITTDVGSICGVIKHGENGLLITPELDDLIYSIKKLVADNSLRYLIANNAYLDAINNYNWEKCFQIYRDEILSM